MVEPRDVLDLLDRGAVAALTPLLAPQLVGWDATSWVRDEWVDGLDSMLGPRRWVVDETRVSSTLTRFHLAGERGTAVATIILDDEGRWFGAALKRRAAEGIANIVLQCPWNEDREAMSELYRELLHLDRWDVPRLVFDEGRPDDPRPRWPDPAHPQQMHLDIRVGDLDAVDTLVVDRGATRLADFDDHRVYADIIGHPFCLYPADVFRRGDLTIVEVTFRLRSGAYRTKRVWLIQQPDGSWKLGVPGDSEQVDPQDFPPELRPQA